MSRQPLAGARSPVNAGVAPGNRSLAWQGGAGQRSVSPTMRSVRQLSASEYGQKHLERGWSYGQSLGTRAAPELRNLQTSPTSPTSPTLQSMMTNRRPPVLAGMKKAVHKVMVEQEAIKELQKQAAQQSSEQLRWYGLQSGAAGGGGDKEGEGEGAEEAVGQLVERAEALVAIVPWVREELGNSRGGLRKEVMDEAVDRIKECIVEMQSVLMDIGRCTTPDGTAMSPLDPSRAGDRGADLVPSSPGNFSYLLRPLHRAIPVIPVLPASTLAHNLTLYSAPPDLHACFR